MTRNRKIAVTGGIGSGKSALCNILKERGYPVFSCDEISNELWQDERHLARLKSAFPSCVESGILQKSALSALVFSDENALKKLNEISHPAIMERLFTEMSKHPLAFAEVPLLFEGGFEREFDDIIVVVREKQARVEALKTRSGWSEEEILSRMARQFDYGKIKDKHCIIIENNGSVSNLAVQADEVIKRLGI